MSRGTQRRSLDELILLPEESAVRAFFNDLDRVVLTRLLVLVAAGSIIGMVWLLVEGHIRMLVAPVVALITVRVLFGASDKPFFERHFRAILLVYLFSHLIGLRLLIYAHWQDVYLMVDFILPLALLFFSLRQSHLLLLLGPVWSASAGRDLFNAIVSDSSVTVVYLVATSAVSIFVFFWVSRQTQKRRQDFLLVWRREHQRNRERHRMREELDEARRIQLSMLPRSDPSSDFFDMAGISIPASEVGGDYYEYFRAENDRQAVVIADVAGHGVASGLLLAGVRSCLYLLKDSPRRPAEVLELLDRVVRETTGRREFVTMLYALFDPVSREVSLSSAGHPPLIQYSAKTGEVEEYQLPSLPLGTRLQRTIEEKTITGEKGDIFLLYTDGIAETVNQHGEVYGNQRLGQRLKAIAHDRSAKEIRDTLLGDVWSFKADGEQTDDITLVVAKIK